MGCEDANYQTIERFDTFEFIDTFENAPLASKVGNCNENGCSTSGIHMSNCNMNDHAASDVRNADCYEDENLPLLLS